MSFKEVPLSEVAESVDYGLTASAAIDIKGPKFLRITDIQDDQVDWGSVPYCVATEREEQSNRLETGDIVFARTGATTGKSFLVRQCPERAVFASYLIRVRPSHRIEPVYLSFFFKSSGYWEQIQSNARGAAQPGVNASVLKELSVPLPTLHEQRRIAAILDQADDLRRKRRAALERLEELSQTLFPYYFGNSDEKKPKWKTAPLSAIVSHFEGGKNIVAEDLNSNSKFRVLKISSIQDEGFDASESKPLPNGYSPPRSHFIRKGDILLSRANTAERVGMVARVDFDSDVLVLPDKILRFVWTDYKNSCPDYWLKCFQTPHVRNRISQLATGTSGSMKNISQEKLLSMECSVPPLDLQRAFAARVAEIDKLKAYHRTHLAQLDALFASLQHRAFRGEL